MKICYSISLCLLLSATCFAQSESGTSKIFFVKVNSGIGYSESQILWGVTDTSLLLATSVGGSIIEQSYRQIESVKIRKKGRNTTVLLSSTASGAALGALIGLATYQKPEQGTWITIDFGPRYDAATGAVLGAVIGLVAGSIISPFTYARFDVMKDEKKFAATANELRNRFLK